MTTIVAATAVAAGVTKTGSPGPLTVGVWDDGYEMDFPADPPRRIAAPEGIADALGVEPAEVWAGAYMMAVLADEAQVRALKPDLVKVEAIGREADRGRGNMIVCAAAAAGRPYDVVSRFFAPGSGIPEDPTTGSAHCQLSPLYAGKLGKASLRFHQAYPGRGGDLECEHKGERVLIRGRAVTVAESVLRV